MLNLQGEKTVAICTLSGNGACVTVYLCVSAARDKLISMLILKGALDRIIVNNNFLEYKNNDSMLFAC